MSTGKRRFLVVIPVTGAQVGFEVEAENEDAAKVEALAEYHSNGSKYSLGVDITGDVDFAHVEVEES